jgi:hypothetical protein
MRGTMSNIDTLKAAYETQIAKLTDTFLSANAAVLLDEFIALKTAALTLSAVTLDSYSVAQRSVQRRKIADANSAANQKQVELHRAIFGMASTSYLSADDELGSVY